MHSSLPASAVPSKTIWSSITGFFKVQESIESVLSKRFWTVEINDLGRVMAGRLFWDVFVVLGLFYTSLLDGVRNLVPHFALAVTGPGLFFGNLLLISIIIELSRRFSYWAFRYVFEKYRKRLPYFIFGYFYVYMLTVTFVCISFVRYIGSVVPNYQHKTRDLSILILVWILFTIIYVFKRWNKHNKHQQAELERQKTHAELAALKAQVNPHFLFNTLNNLYGTALTGDSDRTAAGIEQLSDVMRHMVEESKRDRTPIAKEIQFLENTVDLHRMRLPRRDNIRVKSVMEWDEELTADGRVVEIAPLLLVSFVENAFKYGISINAECFVEIGLSVDQGQLSFSCRNSILPHNRLEVSTGTGIDNIRQRLQLIYPGRHKLSVSEDAGVFSVALSLLL